MRKLSSVFLAVLFVAALGACEEQPTTPDANASVHGAAILTATADIDAVDTEAAEMNGFEPGDDVGMINVTDDRARQTLTVGGSAGGLDESDSSSPLYASLFYDVESTVTGPEACEPALGFDENFDQDRALSLAQMEIGPPDQPIGFWDVGSDGNGTLGPFHMTLSAEKYIKVERIGTVSIRDVRVNDGFGPDAVVGCGTVVID